MINIKIGNEIEVDWAEINPSWLQEQIECRRRAGEDVCVYISIKTSNLDLTLASANCPVGGGGGRRPNEYEQRVFDLWKDFELDQLPIHIGKLTAFIQRVEHDC